MSVIASIQSLLRYASQHPVGQKMPLATYRRIAQWQLQSRLGQGPHELPWIESAKLVVERGMSGATGNLYFGLHEFEDMAFLLHFLRAEDLFFDIGANVGTYSILAGKLVGAQGWAFEPDPATAAKLARNLRSNALEQQIRIVQHALGEINGEIGFTSGLDAMNHVTTDSAEASQVLPIKRLDDCRDDALPVMIKMDVEGHEESAIRGMTQTLALPSLQAIEIETVTSATRSILEGQGFTQFHYDPVSRALHSDSTRSTANNKLFVRDPAFVQNRLSAARTFNIHGWQV